MPSRDPYYKWKRHYAANKAPIEAKRAIRRLKVKQEAIKAWRPESGTHRPRLPTRVKNLRSRIAAAHAWGLSFQAAECSCQLAYPTPSSRHLRLQSAPAPVFAVMGGVVGVAETPPRTRTRWHCADRYCRRWVTVRYSLCAVCVQDDPFNPEGIPAPNITPPR